MRHSVIEELVAKHIPENAYPEQWDTAGLETAVQEVLTLDLPVQDWAKEEGIADEEIEERINDAVGRRMAGKAANYGSELMRMAEKSLLLQILDQSWKEHLLQLDHLRQGINLRAYAQRDPLNEYKSEAFTMFEAMLTGVRETVTSVLCHIEFQTEAPAEQLFQREAPEMEEAHEDVALAAAAGGGGGAGVAVRRRPAAQIDPNNPETWGKVPRNAPCPCGSGRKYKHCHGKLN
jgi:preprotein translocase subunit SecA